VTTARNALAPACVCSQHTGLVLFGHGATEARSRSRRVRQHGATSTCTTATVCCCAPCS
jgi:hypothetical protein